MEELYLSVDKAMPLSLEAIIISHNIATSGGGVYAVRGNIVITQSTITDNRAGSSGGGAYCIGDHNSLESVHVTTDTHDGQELSNRNIYYWQPTV